MLRGCVDAGVDVDVADEYGRTAVFRAAAGGRAAAVRALLALGADPNATSLAGTRDFSPLHFAADAGATGAAEALLAAGAAPSAMDASGTTPFEAAVLSAAPETIAVEAIRAGAAGRLGEGLQLEREVVLNLEAQRVHFVCAGFGRRVDSGPDPLEVIAPECDAVADLVSDEFPRCVGLGLLEPWGDRVAACFDLGAFAF